jgi:hypothetical protein
MADLGPRTTSPDHEALPHVRRMSMRLDDLVSHLRADALHVEEPGFRAMFETAAEVLAGVVTSFRRYERAHVEPRRR